MVPTSPVGVTPGIDGSPGPLPAAPAVGAPGLATSAAQPTAPTSKNGASSPQRSDVVDKVMFGGSCPLIPTSVFRRGRSCLLTDFFRVLARVDTESLAGGHASCEVT